MEHPDKRRIGPAASRLMVMVKGVRLLPGVRQMPSLFSVLGCSARRHVIRRRVNRSGLLHDLVTDSVT